MSVTFCRHVGLCVADLERSLRFYCEGLGFQRVSRLRIGDEYSAKLLGIEDVDLEAVFIERDGIRLELLHYHAPGHESNDAPRPMNRAGLTHMAMRVDDLAATLRALEAHGVRVLDETRIQNPEYASDVVYVLDPDGVRIELIQMPGDPAAMLGEPFDG